MVQNIRLVLEYDGTGFCGWQRQTDQLSIQGCLEAALVALTGDTLSFLRLTAAGRTDAGVHACGQVVNFHTTDMREDRRFAPALNHQLPETIRVQKAECVPEAFDSRHDASGKHYRYLVSATAQPSALHRNRAWHVRRPVSLDALREAAEHLVGHHDYESFRSAHCDAPHARRHIVAIEISVQAEGAAGKLVAIDYYATAFCRHMCRIISGTLIEAATGRREASSMPQILAARNRAAAGITAVPHGLYLVRVDYGNRGSELLSSALTLTPQKSSLGGKD